MLYFDEDLKDFVFLGDNIPNGIEFCLKQNEEVITNNMPDEVKEVLTEELGNRITRQTIATYTAKLEQNNLIDRNTKNYIYYFAFKQTQRMVEKEEYLKAWHEHWERRKEGMDNYSSIMTMFADYGGVARKQAIPEINGIYTKQIEYLNTLVIERITQTIGGQD